MWKNISRPWPFANFGRNLPLAVASNCVFVLPESRENMTRATRASSINKYLPLNNVILTSSPVKQKFSKIKIKKREILFFLVKKPDWNDWLTGLTGCYLFINMLSINLFYKLMQVLAPAKHLSNRKCRKTKLYKGKVYTNIPCRGVPIMM